MARFRRLSPVGLLLLFATLLFPPGSGRCVQDEIESVQAQRVDTKHPSRRLSSLVAQPIRITTDTHELDTDYSSQKLRDFVINTFVNPAVAVLEQTLAVDPTKNTLFYAPQPCASFWSFGDNNGKCQTLGVSTCSNFVTVPSSYLIPITQCSTSSASSCKASAGGGGAPLTDLLVFFSAKNASSCNSGAIASSGFCALETTTDRPLFGYVNLCPAVVESVDPSVISHNILLILHELIHVLGFSRSGFPYWRDDIGVARSPRDASGVPVATSNSTITYATVRGKSAAFLVTPRVVAAVRAHFNCSTAIGAELEDGGLSSITSASHLEKRLFWSEIMMADASAVIPYLSAITLAALEDTGWYIVTDRTYSRPLPFGRNAGCNFVFSKCITDTFAPINPVFCVAAAKTGCSVDRQVATTCNFGTIPPPLPATQYQYFMGSPNVGGTDSLMDFCPYYRNNPNRRCAIAADGQRTNTNGFSYGYNSLCYATTLSNSTSTSTTSTNDCYKSRCVFDGSSSSIQVSVGNKWYPCPAAGTVTIPGFSGRLSCPTSDEMAVICMSITPMFPALYGDSLETATGASPDTSIQTTATTSSPSTSPSTTATRTTSPARSTPASSVLSSTAPATGPGGNNSAPPNTTLACPPNFYGPTCGVFCPLSCATHGSCDPATGVCVCVAGFYSASCALSTTPVRTLSTSITKSGGIVALDPVDGEWIAFPQGSLTTDTTVTVDSYDSKPLLLPPGANVTSSVLDLSPAGAVIQKPFSLQLKYTPLPLENTVYRMHVYSAGIWSPLNRSSSRRRRSSNTYIIASASNFGLFAVLAIPAVAPTASASPTPVSTPAATVPAVTLENNSDTNRATLIIALCLAFSFCAVVIGAVTFQRYQKRKREEEEEKESEKEANKDKEKITPSSRDANPHSADSKRPSAISSTSRRSRDATIGGDNYSPTARFPPSSDDEYFSTPLDRYSGPLSASHRHHHRRPSYSSVPSASHSAPHRQRKTPTGADEAKLAGWAGGGYEERAHPHHGRAPAVLQQQGSRLSLGPELDPRASTQQKSDSATRKGNGTYRKSPLRGYSPPRTRQSESWEAQGDRLPHPDTALKLKHGKRPISLDLNAVKRPGPTAHLYNASTASASRQPPTSHTLSLATAKSSPPYSGPWTAKSSPLLAPIENESPHFRRDMVSARRQSRDSVPGISKPSPRNSVNRYPMSQPSLLKPTVLNSTADQPRESVRGSVAAEMSFPWMAQDRGHGDFSTFPPAPNVKRWAPVSRN